MTSNRVISKPLKLKVITMGDRYGKRPKTTFLPITYNRISQDVPQRLCPTIPVQLHDFPAVPETPESDPGPVCNTYQRRKERAQQQWDNIRDTLFDVGSSTEIPCTNVCCRCGDDLEGPIRCRECGINAVYCSECETIAHKYVLHKPEIWCVSTIINIAAIIYFLFRYLNNYGTMFVGLFMFE